MLLLKTFEFPVAGTPLVKIGFSNSLLKSGEYPRRYH